MWPRPIIALALASSGNGLVLPLSPALAPPPTARCKGASCLLTLGDDPDFDPFAAEYPPAAVPSETTRVKLATTAGDCHIVVDRALAPNGVDRFLALVDAGFFTNQLLYRCVPGMLVQFGVAADPADQAQWEDATIADEPNRATFKGGTVSFAGTGGRDSRSCHLFVALSPGGAALGKAAHEATIGRLEEVHVFEEVAAKYATYGYPVDLADELQTDLIARGNEAAVAYPRLDRILSAERVSEQEGS